MRISDWSSDVCSSDLTEEARIGAGEIGVDRDRQHRLHLAPDRLPVDDQRTLSQLDRVAGQADHALDIVDPRYRMFEHADVAAFGPRAEQPPLQDRKSVG